MEDWKKFCKKVMKLFKSIFLLVTYAEKKNSLNIAGISCSKWIKKEIVTNRCKIEELFFNTF